MKLLLVAALVLGASLAQADPLFPNAVASNDIVFFDPSTGSQFTCMQALPIAAREMPDNGGEVQATDNVTAFNILFLDGVETEIWLDPTLPAAATELYATKVGEAIGRLPTFLRKDLGHIVVLDGNEASYAQDAGRIIVLYTDTIDRRLMDRDLEATLFQVVTDAVLNTPFGQSDGWRAAQLADGDFITDFAAANPETEDLAESALFAYVLLMTPGQLPADLAQAVRDTVPNRLATLGDMFHANLPMFDPSIDLPGCLP